MLFSFIYHIDEFVRYRIFQKFHFQYLNTKRNIQPIYRRTLIEPIYREGKHISHSCLQLSFIVDKANDVIVYTKIVLANRRLGIFVCGSESKKKRRKHTLHVHSIERERKYYMVKDSTRSASLHQPILD